MRISTIALNDIDRLQRQGFEESYTDIENRGGAVDGRATTVVNSGAVGDGFLEVTTTGREEFVLYNTFVAKIRRESGGMAEKTQQRRVAWTNMAQALIDDFGTGKTPPDIVECLANVRTHWIDNRVPLGAIGIGGARQPELEDIELNNIDKMMKDLHRTSFAGLSRLPRSGDYVVTVNTGVGDRSMNVHLKTEEEFCTYLVFLDKIRRESTGMVEATQARRGAWCNMAEAFIKKFGKANVPQDICDHLAQVNARWFS